MDKQLIYGVVVGVVGAVLLSMAIFWIIGMLVGGYAVGRIVGKTRKEAILGGAVVGIIAGSFVAFSLYSTYTNPGWAPSYTWLQNLGLGNAQTAALIVAISTGFLGGTILSIIGSMIGQRSFKPKSNANPPSGMQQSQPPPA